MPEPLVPGTTERTAHVNGIDLHVVEAGTGPPVVLVHGFPELSYSWRHQLPALAGAGYRALAPDMRGYGRSDAPRDVEAYDIEHLTGDLLGLLDDTGEERAVFVGHDWGAIVVWNLAVMAPERVAGVVGMSVPFMPRPDGPPTELMRAVFGDAFFYMLYFQEPGVADAELGGNPARTMRRLLAGATLAGSGGSDAPAPPDPALFAPDGRGFVERLPEPDGLPPWLEQRELDHYVSEFARTGFTGGIDWYRNLDRNWLRTPQLAGAKVAVPSLFVGGRNDPVLLMSPPEAMHEWVTDHRGTVVVDGAGHWVQQEAPGPVNDALLGFLRSVHEDVHDVHEEGN
jgi:pimeloyl-ACP methyl ester carboxylesterase